MTELLADRRWSRSQSSRSCASACKNMYVAFTDFNTGLRNTVWLSS